MAPPSRSCWSALPLWARKEENNDLSSLERRTAMAHFLTSGNQCADSLAFCSGNDQDFSKAWLDQPWSVVETLIAGDLEPDGDERNADFLDDPSIASVMVSPSTSSHENVLSPLVFDWNPPSSSAPSQENEELRLDDNEKDSDRDIGISVKVTNDNKSLSECKSAWQCSYPGCPSKTLFLRICDLRKHYKRHSQRLYCRHLGCPRSIEGSLSDLDGPKKESPDPIRDDLRLQEGSLSDSSSAQYNQTWFASVRDRARHEAKHNPRIRCTWQGGICSRVFSRLDNMRNHVERVHLKLGRGPS